MLVNGIHLLSQGSTPSLFFSLLEKDALTFRLPVKFHELVVGFLSTLALG